MSTNYNDSNISTIAAKDFILGRIIWDGPAPLVPLISTGTTGTTTGSWEDYLPISIPAPNLDFAPEEMKAEVGISLSPEDRIVRILNKLNSDEKDLLYRTLHAQGCRIYK